jgi:hypothetical protein
MSKPKWIVFLVNGLLVFADKLREDKHILVPASRLN